MLKKIAVIGLSALALCSSAFAGIGDFAHPYLKSGTDIYVVSPQTFWVCWYENENDRLLLEEQAWVCNKHESLDGIGIREPEVFTVPDYDDYDGSPVKVMNARWVYHDKNSPQEPCFVPHISTGSETGTSTSAEAQTVESYNCRRHGLDLEPMPAGIILP